MKKPHYIRSKFDQQSPLLSESCLIGRKDWYIISCCLETSVLQVWSSSMTDMCIEARCSKKWSSELQPISWPSQKDRNSQHRAQLHTQGLYGPSGLDLWRLAFLPLFNWVLFWLFFHVPLKFWCFFTSPIFILLLRPRHLFPAAYLPSQSRNNNHTNSYELLRTYYVPGHFRYFIQFKTSKTSEKSDFFSLLSET